MTTFEKFHSLIDHADVMQIDSVFLLTDWVWRPNAPTVSLAFGYHDQNGYYREESFLRTAIEAAEFDNTDGRFHIQNTGGLITQITFHTLEDLK